MGTTRLNLYNQALQELGERSLASLTENRESRRRLDSAWNSDFTQYVLGTGQWKFAKRTQQLPSNPAQTPDFGWRYAFSIPSDLVRLAGVFSDESCYYPLLQYGQERGYYLANSDPLWVSYVSNASNYGGDLSMWPPELVRYATFELASRVALALTQDAGRLKDMKALALRELTDAKSSDAMEGPTRFPPPGRYVLSRTSGGDSRSDGGIRSRLIGG